MPIDLENYTWKGVGVFEWILMCNMVAVSI